MTSAVQADPEILIIGIDPGVEHLGVAWRTRPGAVGTLCIDFPFRDSSVHAQIDDLARMVAAARAAVARIRATDPRRCLVVLEDYYLSNRRGGGTRAELSGALRCMLRAEIQEPPFVVRPNTARALVFGGLSRSDQKRRVLAWVRDLLGDLKLNEHEADAYVVMRACELMWLRDRLSGKYRRQALAAWQRNMGARAPRGGSDG